MKKTTAFILALLLCLNLSCSVRADTASFPVHIEGAIFGGKSDDSIALTFSFDPARLTAADSTVYDPELAAFAAVLCADSYFREKDLAKGTQNRVLPDGSSTDDYDFTSLLRTVGFPETKHIESFKEKEYTYDTNDSVTMNLAYSGAYGGRDTFIVAVRGCYSAGEWASVFDPGYMGEDAPAFAGDHPEWTDRNLFKGIAIAADRALDFIDAFVAEHDDPAKENCFLITGHSRGGAIAEVIGAAMEGRNVLCRTYAFNSVPVTDDPAAEGCRTVFNIFDSRDFFSDCLPFGAGPMYRYGRSVTKDISASPELLSGIAAVKGRDDYTVLSAEKKNEYDMLFGARFPDRRELYVPKTVSEVFDSKEAADSRLAELQALIGPEAGLGLDLYCSAAVTETDSGYAAELRYCDAALILSIGKILAYGGSAVTAVRSLFARDEAFMAVTDFLTDNYASISGGHLIVNSLVLALSGTEANIR